ncbi:uncharacterized protein LOC131879891 isoform X2 [Tigriopus californicus]|uniref:uncharacterized protein LOC131879891 isoform X2 n=1 Tax=Tigriopus californicus TaxID=6832 RepID=UPI0027DA79DF|nr:uncharacterized protein LOC131879891 isoform X2 [Tigriopus californicus]
MENEDQGSYSSSPATGNSPGTMAGTQWSPGTVPSSPHSPILTVSTAPPDPHINTSPLPTTPIPISQFQNHEQVFFPNSLPNVSMMGMNPVVTGNQYFADKQGCLQSTASLPVTPWLHKRYPHLAHSPSPIIHESADNLFFGRDDFSVQQPLRSMGSVPATVVVSSNASSSDVVLKQTCCSSTSSVVSSTTTCTSSSPRHAQHPGGNVRLSDSDICKILSIPMNLVADPYSGDDELIFEEPPDLLLQPTPNLAVTSQTMSVVTNAVPRGGGGTGGGGGGRDLDCSSSSSPQISSSSNGTHYSCDKESTSSPGITTTKTTTTEERNFLHFSKGMTTDQSAMNHLQYGYQNQQHQNIPNGSKSESLTNYRSSNVHSPAGNIQGSPHGRSASPVDMVGSPNSPGVLGSSPSRSPPAHSPMSGGGTVVYGRESQGSNQRPNAQGFHHQPQQQQQQQQQQHQAQSELAKDFQKFSVPINDFSGYFNNYASDMNGKANQLINNQPYHPPGSMAPQTPQTPSSIPDIIFTDVDDDGSTNFHGGLGPNFDADSWSQELSANMADIIRDDTMFKLLSEGSNSPFDQQISDTLSEEHFAS